MPQVLHLENICKSFKNKKYEQIVLQDTSFTLNHSQIVALIAPSGVGKSTLLHIAGLLDKPDSGEVFIYKQPCAHLSNSQRTKIRGHEIGFIYQEHYLLPEFTALENVMMPMLIAGNSYKKSFDRASKLLAYLKIKDQEDSRPGEMSGGQRQRVAIARAVINAPSILLADEPTGNLDPKTAQQVFSIIYQLAKEAGIATIIATHNYELAKKMDKIITIKNTKIVELR